VLTLVKVAEGASGTGRHRYLSLNAGETSLAECQTIRCRRIPRQKLRRFTSIIIASIPAAKPGERSASSPMGLPAGSVENISTMESAARGLRSMTTLGLSGKPIARDRVPPAAL
jgi:hypothetical protein